MYLLYRGGARVDAMAHILFGFTLISASLQTGWALFCEGQHLALPVVVLILFLGWRSLVGAFEELA